MSVFASYKPKAEAKQPVAQTADSAATTTSKPKPMDIEPPKPKKPAGKEKAVWGKSLRQYGLDPVAPSAPMASASAAIEDLFCGATFGDMELDSSMTTGCPDDSMHEEKVLEGEAYDYIRENCIVPKTNFKTFGSVVGVPNVVAFAQDFQAAAGKGGAIRPVSGLLLFGPSGTGKSASAQAIAHYLNGAFYSFSSADMPTATDKQAQRITALFDVALAGPRPAIIFLDEIDTLLGPRATNRVGHFAKEWGRFTDGLLVIGATNSPTKIAPKIIGRLERKILVDNPNPDARRALILRQLAQEKSEQMLAGEDLAYLIKATQGRSAVNMERLVSTAVLRAGGLPVSRIDFELALEEEPSDYDPTVAKANAKYNAQYGWKRRLLPPRFFDPWEDRESQEQQEEGGESDSSD